MKKLAAGMAVVALLAGTVNAVSFSGSAQGWWTGIDAEGRNTEYGLLGSDLGSTARLLWGEPGWCDPQSELSWDGAGTDANNVPEAWLSSDVPLMLGDLYYRNTPVYSGSGINGADLNVKVKISDNNALIGEFLFPLAITERRNPQPDTIAWNSTMPAPVSFQYGGDSYEFSLLGFGSESCNGALQIVDQITLGEDRCKTVHLYGNLTKASTVPDGAMTALLLGTAMAGLEGLRRRLRR